MESPSAIVSKILTKKENNMKLRRMMGLLVTSLSVGSFMFAGCTQQGELDVQAQEPAADVQAQKPAPNVQTEQRQPDVPYVPTPEVVVEQMLALAKVTKNDVLYDLGSGDGRIVITAAQKFGTRGVGVDINPERIREAKENARKAGVTDLVQFRQQDLFETDISKATVVTLYLLPDINLKLRPRLFKELKPGTRIVSHDFDMGEWKPERVVQVQGPARQHTLYYWVVPKNVPANLR
jgi:predicted O-methyltransferase YrrM